MVQTSVVVVVLWKVALIIVLYASREGKINVFNIISTLSEKIEDRRREHSEHELNINLIPTSQYF